jgi:hypothetical protein
MKIYDLLIIFSFFIQKIITNFLFYFKTIKIIISFFMMYFTTYFAYHEVIQRIYRGREGGCGNL